MRNTRRIVWGIIFIAAAVVLVLNSFNIIEFDLFFDGWWTLFIIVPSIAGIFEKNNKTESIVGLGIGILFLLCAQNIIDWDMVWKIALPVVIATIGIKMIISAFKKTKGSKRVSHIEIKNGHSQRGIAIFSGTELDFDSVVFEGADLVAVFGGVDCDLRGAIIDQDCVINAACVFGGIDIKVPDNVQVINNSATVFGGIDVHKNNPTATHKLYIEGACIFGGIDIK